MKVMKFELQVTGTNKYTKYVFFPSYLNSILWHSQLRTKI